MLFAANHRKVHFTFWRVVRFVYRSAVFRNAVAVVIAVTQPPVVVRHKLRIHLFDPCLIAGGFVHFHYRPRSKAWLGITFVPVASVAATFWA